jgi:hypothetical protein
LDLLMKTFHPKFHLKNLRKDTTEAIWTWRERVCQDFLVYKAKKYSSKHVFSPLNIAMLWTCLVVCLTFSLHGYCNGLKLMQHKIVLIYCSHLPQLLAVS